MRSVGRQRRGLCLWLLFLSLSALITAMDVGAAVVKGKGNIGVNYGTLANNLPPPSEVARLLKGTKITKVKLFQPIPDILHAFAGTAIEFILGISDDQILPLANAGAANQWIADNVVAYSPATRISALAVGNEVVATKDKRLIAYLLRAMANLHAALVSAGLDSQVKVSTPHSLGILRTSVPPSEGAFRPGFIKSFFVPMLDFLSRTGAPFMVNVYPFFGYIGGPSEGALEYALFTSPTGYTDPNTSLHYTNMYDAQLDAIYSAMAALGYKDVEIMVTETGWPSLGGPGEVGVSLVNAQTFNGNLIKHTLSGKGTPLRPGQSVDTYIFALFNENLKPGPISEQNYGLFKPDMKLAYDIDIFNNQEAPSNPIAPAPSQKSWCVSTPGASPSELSKIIQYACGEGGEDCRSIEAGGDCYQPNIAPSHASYAMNLYYQRHGRHRWDCYFNKSGVIVFKNPSYGSCVYPS